ncbi:MAG: hypothetical protein KDA28_09545, partial [Phycisphaerales bacterium]|nr:hypothetical protein [Phycisphaerales bacterium]
SPPSPDLDAVRRLIEDYRPTDAVQDLAGALELVDISDGASIVLLSEFRRGGVSLDDPLPQTGAQIHVAEPASTVVENIGITSFTPLRSLLIGSDSGMIATVELARHGSRRADATTVRFHVESDRRQDLGTHVVRWEDGQAEASFSITLDAVGGIEGDAILSASIDDDLLEADNRMLAPVRVRHAIRVAIVTPRRFEGGDLDAYRPADWIRLALSPQVTGGRAIEVVELDPAVADLPALADVDAALVTRPDRVPDWIVYRDFVARGGLLFITPPPSAEVHLWTDGFLERFGLEWTIAREATDVETTIRVEDTRRPATDLFGLIRAEFGALARPVAVARHLAIEAS